MKWEVVTRARLEGSSVEEQENVGFYDAVVVANGHYSVPRVAQLEGMDTYPAIFEHSQDYRRPESYAGKRVMLVGASTSGTEQELCR